MTDLVISKVHIVESIDQFDAPSNEVFDFEAVRYHTDGTVTPGNGTTSTEAAFQGIATNKSTRVGQAVTVLREGIVDVGDALDALAINAPVYLSDTDGLFADAAGTVSVICGRVVPGWGNTTSDKLLRVLKGG